MEIFEDVLLVTQLNERIDFISTNKVEISKYKYSDNVDVYETNAIVVNYPHWVWKGDEKRLVVDNLPASYNVDGIDFTQITTEKVYVELQYSDLYDEPTVDFLEIGSVGMFGNYRYYSQCLSLDSHVTIITTDTEAQEIAEGFGYNDIDIFVGNIIENINSLDADKKFTYVFISILEEADVIQIIGALKNNLAEDCRIKVNKNILKNIKKAFPSLSFVNNSNYDMHIKMYSKEHPDGTIDEYELQYRHLHDLRHNYRDQWKANYKIARKEYRSTLQEKLTELENILYSNTSQIVSKYNDKYIQEIKNTVDENGVSYIEYYTALEAQPKQDYEAKLVEANGDETLIENAKIELANRLYEIEQLALLHYKSIYDADLSKYDIIVSQIEKEKEPFITEYLNNYAKEYTKADKYATEYANSNTTKPEEIKDYVINQ